MTRIGNGPISPPIGGQSGVDGKKDQLIDKNKSDLAQTKSTATSTKTKDSFELAQSQLANRLQNISQKKVGLSKLQFTNSELADLVKVFAGVLLKNPGADRLKRAKLFTSSLLNKT